MAGSSAAARDLCIVQFPVFRTGEVPSLLGAETKSRPLESHLVDLVGVRQLDGIEKAPTLIEYAARLERGATSYTKLRL